MGRGWETKPFFFLKPQRITKIRRKPVLAITPSTETNSPQMSNIFLNKSVINNTQGKSCLRLVIQLPNP